MAESARHLKWPCQAGLLQVLKLPTATADVSRQGPTWHMGTEPEEREIEAGWTNPGILVDRVKRFRAAWINGSFSIPNSVYAFCSVSVCVVRPGIHSLCFFSGSSPRTSPCSAARFADSLQLLLASGASLSRLLPVPAASVYVIGFEPPSLPY